LVHHRAMDDQPDVPRVWTRMSSEVSACIRLLFRVVASATDK
jgi:hypothetical protein